MLMSRSHMISGITCLLFASVSSAATLKGIAEQRYTKKIFDDRTEHYGVYRNSVSTIFPNIPQSSAVYIPLTASVSNLDTTHRGATAELLRSDFAGRTQSFGRVGDVDALIALDNQNILIQTRNTLAKMSLLSQEEVWKIVLPAIPGQVVNVRYGDNGFIYVQGPDLITKIRASNGAVEKQIYPLAADVGTYWGMQRVLKNGQILIFGDSRYAMIDENAKVLWRSGKVYPEKSYGGSQSVGALTLLSEYISLTNPDPALARRYAHTLIQADGKEVWSRIGSLLYLTQDQEQFYFEDYTDLQRTKLVAVAKATGKTVWSTDLELKRDVSMNAQADDGRVVLGRLNEVRVYGAKDGALISAKSWPDRFRTEVLSVLGRKIVTIATGAVSPNDQFINFLEIDTNAE